MARLNLIELHDGQILPILSEDRSVPAIDKPAGWMQWRYRDPFIRRTVCVRAPVEAFLRDYGFDLPPDFDKLC